MEYFFDDEHFDAWQQHQFLHGQWPIKSQPVAEKPIVSILTERFTPVPPYVPAPISFIRTPEPMGATPIFDEVYADYANLDELQHVEDRAIAKLDSFWETQ